MKSLQVTSNGNQLYTVVHSPPESTKTSLKHAVVICMPITHEHDTCYWAMRQLALRLSRIGLNVVRFDYFATGNSSGLSQQLSIQTCVQNIVDIGHFIVEKTNSKKLTFIGFRLGGALASIASTSLPPDHLILWDPIINGKNYLNELAKLNDQFLQKKQHTPSNNHKLGQEYLGYPYSDNLITELYRIHQDKIDLPVNMSLSILTSPDNFEQNQYVKAMKNSRASFQHIETTKWPINSQDIATLDSSFLPGKSINQICNLLKLSQ